MTCAPDDRIALGFEPITIGLISGGRCRDLWFESGPGFEEWCGLGRGILQQQRVKWQLTAKRGEQI